MSYRSRLGTPGLLLRHIGSDRAASVLLAVLVGIAVLVVALVPRALAVLAEDELHHELDTASVLRVDVTATGQLGKQATDGEPADADAIFGQFEKSLAQFPKSLPQPLAGLVAGPEWVARLPEHEADPVVPTRKVQPNVSLAIDVGWEKRVTFASGAAPAQWQGSSSDSLSPAERPPIEVALSKESADEMGVVVGDILSSEPAPLKVAGIYSAVDSNDPYWVHSADLLHPTLGLGSSDVLVSAAAYISPMSVVGLGEDAQSADLQAWYPVLSDKLHFPQAAAVLAETRQLASLGFTLPNGEQLIIQTGLTDVIQAVLNRIGSVTAVLALTVSAPLGVVFAVLSLGVRTVIERRRAAIALVGARGASAAQLRAAMLLEGVVIAIPVSIVAVLVAALVLPTPVGPDSLVLPAVVALAVPVLFVATTTPRALRQARSDLTTGSAGRWRWIVEVAVIALAALALFLLVRRGLLTSSAAVGVDPLLAATPLLLSLAACVVVLRVYPFPLLALQRRVRARRGAVGMLGAARAVRDTTAGFASVLAMVVGVSAAVCSLVMATTIGSGLAATALEQVGSDIRIEAPELPADLVKAAAATPGVKGVAALEIAPDVVLGVGFDQVHVSVIFADLAALRQVRPDIPAPSTGGDGVPFIISSGLADRMRAGTTQLGDKPAYRAGVVAKTALPGTQNDWILVDSSHEQEVTQTGFLPTRLLVALDGSAKKPTVSKSLFDAVVAAQAGPNGKAVRMTQAATVLDETTSRPSTGGLVGALQAAAGVSLLLGILTIVLGSVAATGVRNRFVGVLRMLGMSRRQVDGLVAWELAPVAISAVVIGTALGLVLPYLVTAVLDLRPFTGGSQSVTPVIPVTIVVGVALGFAAVVVLAGFAAVSIGRRISPAQTVKMGAE